MRRAAAALALLATLSVSAFGQTLPFTLPANTVIGRSVDIGPGEATAIPFSVLAAKLAPFAPFVVTCPAHQFVNSISSSASGCAQPAAGDVSGLAAIATSGSATDLTAGTVAAARFPALTGDVTTSPGSVNTTLVAGNAGNLNSGTLPAGRMPAHTGDVASSAGSVALTVQPNVVDNTKLAQMPATTFKGNNTGGTANANDLTVPTSLALLRYPAYLAGFANGVNFNSVADTSIALTLPGGVTKWRLFAFVATNEGTTASLTTAQYGLFSGAGGTGTAIIAGGTAMNVITSNAVNTGINFLASGGSIQAYFNFTTVFFRITTAQGAAASGSVYVLIMPLP